MCASMCRDKRVKQALGIHSSQLQDALLLLLLYQEILLSWTFILTWA